MVAGFLVGWERESHGRPAGLRTNILACVASAVAMILSDAVFLQTAASVGPGAWRPDPARLGAGILTGIGFLGAGTIMRHDNFVRGVTTAATLWAVAVLGLAFGSGQFLLGTAGLLICLLTLYILPRFEKTIQSNFYSKLTIFTDEQGLPLDELKTRLKTMGAVVLSARLDYNLQSQERTVELELKMKRPQRMQQASHVVQTALTWPGVRRVSWS